MIRSWSSCSSIWGNGDVYDGEGEGREAVVAMGEWRKNMNKASWLVADGRSEP